MVLVEPATKTRIRQDNGNGTYKELAWLQKHKALTPAERQTAQDFEPPNSLGVTGYDSWFFMPQRAELLPTWGTKNRDWHLRRYWRDPYNWIAQGAISNVIKKVASTPYEIKGGKILAKRYQDLFASAHFGEYGGGWRGFISRLLLDFFTQDFGAVIEIIGPGNPKSRITGRVSGVAHLDALRCDATGNPEYPIVYWSRRTNKMHLMHRTRVVRLVDMPDTDEAYYGNGLCALSRMISIVQAEIQQAKYIVQRLDDLPPDGFIGITGLLRSQWDEMRTRYEAERQREGSDIWASTMVVISPDVNTPVKFEAAPFSTTPDHFNYREYVEIHVNAVALTLGVDPQDIWPLTGAPIGTGTQSGILHSKSMGKTFGDVLTMLERMINFFILPEALEFKFKFEDPIAEKEKAENASKHIDVAKGLSELHSKEIALQYLAENVESFQDVLLDEAGEIVELPDDDPKTDEQTIPIEIPEATVTEDGTPVTPAPTQPNVTTTDAAQVDGGVGRREHDSASQDKQLQAVRLDFEGDVEDTIAAARSGSLTKRRFSTIMRAHINKYGRDAFEEGLKEGGVDDGPDDDDLGAIAKMVAEQTSFVANLANAVYSEDGISDTLAVGKPAIWFNKSIMPFYQAGMMSADRNGMYEWIYGDTEHCEDCKRLNGQRHRLKAWYSNGWIPQDSRLACGGFNCKCRLKKTTGSARGRF